jgi:sodium/hydrogen antiporter
MLLLFTFVILGSSLIWTGFAELNGATIAFAAFSVLIRVPIYLLSLLRSNVNRRGRLVIAWFGPSGLSSLLLVLLAVFAGAPGSEQIFAICSLIVLLSIVIHGTSPMLLARFTKKQELPGEPSLPVEESPVEEKPVKESSHSVGKQTITLDELDQLEKAGEQVILLDVRTDRSRDTSDSHAKGSVRMPPENVVLQAREFNLPKDAWLIAYCA